MKCSLRNMAFYTVEAIIILGIIAFLMLEFDKALEKQYQPPTKSQLRQQTSIVARWAE